jgi:hypothetical protein
VISTARTAAICSASPRVFRRLCAGPRFRRRSRARSFPTVIRAARTGRHHANQARRAGSEERNCCGSCNRPVALVYRLDMSAPEETNASARFFDTRAIPKFRSKPVWALSVPVAFERPVRQVRPTWRRSGTAPRIDQLQGWAIGDAGRDLMPHASCSPLSGERRIRSHGQRLGPPSGRAPVAVERLTRSDGRCRRRGARARTGPAQRRGSIFRRNCRNGRELQRFMRAAQST